MMRALILALLVTFAGPASAQVTDKAVLQSQIESGSDLSSRASRVLFKARARQDDGEYAEAAASLESWLGDSSHTDHHLLRFQLAASYLGLEQAEKAVAALELAVQLEPKFARAWLRLGEAAYALESFGTAGDAFSNAYDLSPEQNPTILYYAGVCLLSDNQAVRSLELLMQLIDENATVATRDWYQALIAAAVDAKAPEKAEPYLVRLVDSDPSDPANWRLAYQFHAGQADYEKAASDLTIASYLEDLNAKELGQLGDLYAFINVPLQAARYYERALQLKPEPMASDYRRLASAWMGAFEWDAARVILDTGLAVVPTTKLWALKGDLEYSVADYAASLVAFEASVNSDQGFGRGHLMMGYCALELGDEKAAREYLNRAAAFSDHSKSATSLLAQLDAR
ncbi:MAG: Tfp pilus assembly protein PilF [Candidatus Krumholzibacteriia bacterium]|jgi:Tfp pilus assembly protein PilF